MAIRAFGLFLLFSILPFLVLGTEPLWGVFQPSEFSNKKTVLLSWSTPEGQKRLNQSQFKNDFFQLAHHFQPQINPLYCGAATGVIILNAFRQPTGKVDRDLKREIPIPKTWGSKTLAYPSYSQLHFFNDQTDPIKNRKIIGLENYDPKKELDTNSLNPGVELPLYAKMLETYNLHVKTVHASASLKEGITEFRKVLRSILHEQNHFIVANFRGKPMGAATGGHISPLAAYDQKSDSVLILDVAGHKNPWYWAPVSDFYQAMHTKDGDHFRGYLIVSDKK